METEARRQHIRLLSYDRPGYGGSSPRPGRRIGDAADDVAAICGALDLDRVAIYGFSGGAAPALACAAKLPGRVVAVAAGAGLAPFDAVDLDWFEGMSSADREEFDLLTRDRPSWERKLLEDRDQILAWTAPQLLEAFAPRASPADRQSMTPEWGEFLLAWMQEGLRPGPEGLRDDTLSAAAPIGFDPSTISVPVQIWHGGQDRLVPFGHGVWWSRHLAGAEAHLDPNLGHGSLFRQTFPEILRWLVQRF